MPLGAQPPGHRGTVGHPYSALNLRLVLACFGLVCCVVLGIALILLGPAVLGWVVLALGIPAAVDIVVIQLRRQARRREDHEKHSLFE